jgi:hypothetical protein
VAHVSCYQLFIPRKLYKLATNNIMHRFMMDHENLIVVWESHDGLGSGHYRGKAIAKTLHARIWWEILFIDVMQYAK